MKTLQKVRERFYWNNERSDEEKRCRIWDPCAARKGPRKRTKGRLPLYNGPEAYPISDQEASTAAEVLVQYWISRFGVPLQLHPDQGRNFDSAVCKRLCEIFAIDKTRTTALHPQPDGTVERFNRNHPEQPLSPGIQ
ncbi:retrovirus-related Pol polyprotein from transposon 412 [Trichonephila clavipes]|nr:retrovirus-related Pol polyprotein from transposon 412 [Trichonephila clavipes]